MATPAATAFVLITSSPSAPVYGIVYSDGKVLSVGSTADAMPQLRTLSQIRALELTLTAIPIPIGGAADYLGGGHIQPCTIVYPDGAAVAAIAAYDKLIFRGASGAASDIAIRASAASEVNKGANIHSRFGVSARPWGAATTATVTGFGQG